MVPLSGQSALLPEEEQEALRDTLDKYKRALKAGDSTVIWPLATLLDDQRLTTQKYYFGQDTVTVAHLAWRAFFWSTYLEDFSEETPITGAMLRAYWRDTTQGIVFSPLLGRFTDAPPGTREVRYQLQPAAPQSVDKAGRLAEYQAKIAHAVAHKDFFMPVKLIPEIGKLGTPEAFAYLKECAAGRHWGRGESPRHNQVMEAIIQGLGSYRSMESARLVLELTRRLEGWGSNGFVASMDRITGIHLAAHWRADQDSLVEAYELLLDSLPSLQELQEMGFRRADPARPEDFADRGAYLEYLITRPGQKDWVVAQALRELEERHDSRVLVQLAALRLHETVFSAKGLWKGSRHRLERLTGVRLLVENKRGALVADGYDRVKNRNALYYWAKHYKKYAWSDAAGRFVYQGDDIAPLDTLAVLVEQLYQKDDAAALRAVSTLMHLPLDTLERRLEGRYFTYLHGANKALPYDLKAKLSALAEVLGICRSLGYPTRLSDRAEAVLRQLSTAANVAERDKLLSTLDVPTPSTVTALEAWAYAYANRGGSYLDRWLKDWYADQWSTMSLGKEELRLFLLKSALRRRGRFKGLWKGFEGMIREAGPEALAAIKALADREEDERIRLEVAGILARAQVQSQDSFTVAEYLDLGALGAPVPPEQVVVELNTTALADMFGRFDGCSKEARYRLLQLVDHHRDTTITPFLLALATDTSTVTKSFISRRTDKGRFTERFSIRQGDYMVWILRSCTASASRRRRRLGLRRR